MRPPSGQDDGLRLFAADKQMGRTELLPFTPNVCVLRCRRVQLRGELCSALGAATGEDLAAVGGSHSLSEAMYLASLSLLRLICSEHNYTPFLLSKNTIDRRLEGVRGLRSLTNPAFAQIDNIHYISTMRGLSRGLGFFFSSFVYQI